MGAIRTAAAVGGAEAAVAALSSEGCSAPRFWENSPGDTYGSHSHGYHKVLFCLSGSIVFHLAAREVELRAGDRLDLEPGTEHAATVGPAGVRCVEGSR
jgi:mannose-6-phosphate isomerase-like protein (cupin superfamily)